jgi:hypothetical protein
LEEAALRDARDGALGGARVVLGLGGTNDE